MMRQQVWKSLSAVATRRASGSALSRAAGPSQQRHLAAMAATSPLLEQRTMKVPTMGDSITEGTIVEWTAQVGQGVKEGEVVALVETDKVTVEIKAEIDGVITQHFGAVDDTIEVGGDLYELDTEAEATVEASAVSSSEEAAAAPTTTTSADADTSSATASTSTTAATTVASSSSTQQRVPSIQFLGKDGWAQVKSGQKPGAPQIVYVPPTYGRPVFTEEEMEALILGGASVAPSIVTHSGGAKFAP